MSDSTLFASGWFTGHRLIMVQEANAITRGPGAEDRIRIVDKLREEIAAATKSNPLTRSLDIDIYIQSKVLKAWVIGIVEGWKAQGVDDRHCRTLMEAAKALRCWGAVQKHLPQADLPDFEADSEIEEEVIVPDEAEA